MHLYQNSYHNSDRTIPDLNLIRLVPHLETFGHVIRITLGNEKSALGMALVHIVFIH